MTNKQEHITVQVKVHPALKEYILAINEGSDTIVPEKDSRLWGTLRQYLETIPADYVPQPLSSTPENVIQVALLNGYHRIWDIKKKRLTAMNPLFRCYLSPKGQRAIARYLMADFKHTFRAYMTGAISNNPDLSITDAIDEFCTDYKITMQQLTMDLLRKDWYRWRQKGKEEEKAPSSWQN